MTVKIDIKKATYAMLTRMAKSLAAAVDAGDDEARRLLEQVFSHMKEVK